MASPEDSTTVGFSATITILSNEVTISSQDINNVAKDGINFTLSQPIVLGSLDDLLNWMTSSLHIPVPTPTEIDNAVKGTFLESDWIAVSTGVLTITALSIQQKTNYYMLAFTYSLGGNGLTIPGVDFIALNALGVSVAYQGTPTSP